jgi:hypothetical protein
MFGCPGFWRWLQASQQSLKCLHHISAVWRLAGCSSLLAPAAAHQLQEQKKRHHAGSQHLLLLTRQLLDSLLAGYKSVYFNLEAATVLLCGWTFVWVNALGVSMQRILLLFRAGRLSYRALVPALLSFYPLFYVSGGGRRARVHSALLAMATIHSDVVFVSIAVWGCRHPAAQRNSCSCRHQQQQQQQQQQQPQQIVCY